MLSVEDEELVAVHGILVEHSSYFTSIETHCTVAFEACVFVHGVHRAATSRFRSINSNLFGSIAPGRWRAHSGIDDIKLLLNLNGLCLKSHCLEALVAPSGLSHIISSVLWTPSGISPFLDILNSSWQNVPRSGVTSFVLSVSFRCTFVSDLVYALLFLNVRFGSLIDGIVA